MTKDEALKMAIELLESLKTEGENFQQSSIHIVCSICEKALAEQPTQEPIIVKQDNGMVLKLGYDDLPNGTPFYTHPKQWQGLSDEERETILMERPVDNFGILGYGKAIEAKLREKNG